MGKNIRSKIQNEALKIFIWVVWLGINIYLFVKTYLLYQRSDKYHYMYMVLKDSICISRACAMSLNFNCALILIPMCRTINSWIRTKLLKYIHSNPRRLMNHMKGLHIMCAYSICILGVIHSLSHLVNCLRFHVNFTYAIQGINVNESKSNITLWWFLTQIPGWTGILMLLILVVVIITSFQAVRRKHYEYFWYTHHLSLFFLVVTCVHGFGKITRYQINLDKHPRECHNLQEKTWMMNNTLCQEEPRFQPNDPSTWKWVIGPFCLYLIDRMIRLFRGLKTCKISKVVLHEDKAIELHMLKKGFQGKPGQYILIQCPDIAEFEWHAFTLTKCPTSKEDPTFSVHIKVAGDWTKSLQQHLSESCEANGVQLHRKGECCIIEVENDVERQEEKLLPIIRVDGPYGSPNEDWSRYPLNISVAAGIGITPFAAVLNYLKALDPQCLSKNFKLQRMYLIWTCRDVKEFIWFLELMISTQKHLASINMSDMLVCQLHLTKSKIADDDPSLTTEKMQWLQKRLNYGRVNLSEELKTIALSYYKKRIGVFYCGPPSLSEVLYKACVTTNIRGNTFIYHKESFA